MRIPIDLSAQARTRAPLLGQGLPGLSPIQLACFLGDAKMFEYLLVQQLQVEWKWGPVVSYKLPLMEIDSSGPSLHDVMEIILLPDAKQQVSRAVPEGSPRGSQRKPEEAQGSPREIDEARGSPGKPEGDRGSPRKPREARGRSRKPEEAWGMP